MSKYTALIEHSQPPPGGETLTQPLTLWQKVQLVAVALIAIAAMVSPVSLPKADPVIEQRRQEQEAMKDLRRVALKLHSDNVALRLELDRLRGAR